MHRLSRSTSILRYSVVILQELLHGYPILMSSSLFWRSFSTRKHNNTKTQSVPKRAPKMQNLQETVRLSRPITRDSVLYRSVFTRFPYMVVSFLIFSPFLISIFECRKIIHTCLCLQSEPYFPRVGSPTLPE